MIDHYVRILPRDAFNEANLLKCLGRLFLLIDDRELSNGTLVHDYCDRPFCISQDDSNGAIAVMNVYFLQHGGKKYHFWRPLNSRQPWPVYIETTIDPIQLFDEYGNLNTDFKDFIGLRP